MNIKYVYTLTMAALLLAGATSCKKEQDNVLTTSDKTPAFVGKKWKMMSYTLDTPVDFNGDGTLDNDLTAFLDKCDKDDVVIFQADGKVMGDHGPQRCNTDQATVEQTNTWTFDSATQVLRLREVNNPASVSDWRVLVNDGKTLKASVEVREDGVAFKTTLTLKN